MKKTRTYLAMGLLATTALFTSCDKDDDDNPINSGDRSKVILGEWELTRLMGDKAVDLNDDGNYFMDALNYEFEYCGRDDRYYFLHSENTGNTFSRRDSPYYGEVCNDDGNLETIFEYEWELSEDQEAFLMDYDKDGQADSTWDIISFTKNEVLLQYSEELTVEGGTTEMVTFDVTFNRI